MAAALGASAYAISNFSIALGNMATAAGTAGTAIGSFPANYTGTYTTTTTSLWTTATGGQYIGQPNKMKPLPKRYSVHCDGCGRFAKTLKKKTLIRYQVHCERCLGAVSGRLAW